METTKESNTVWKNIDQWIRKHAAVIGVIIGVLTLIVAVIQLITVESITIL